MNRELLLSIASLYSPFLPTDKPCSDVNPDLWRVWCKLTNRYDGPNDLWTEADVIQHIDLILKPRGTKQVV